MDVKIVINNLKQRMANENKKKLIYDIFTLDDNIEELELSTRAYNCLKRCKYNDIKTLLLNTDNLRNLNNIKNLGDKSKKEIQSKMFIYQLKKLKNEDVDAYINKCVEMSV